MTGEKKVPPGEVLGYQSYLLRLWREKRGDSIQWRASLQDPHSNERIGFAHLNELVAFLHGRIGMAAPVEDLAKAQSSPERGLASEEA